MEPAERVLATKRIPTTPWRIVRTSSSEFYHHATAALSTWTPPPEILPILRDVLEVSECLRAARGAQAPGSREHQGTGTGKRPLSPAPRAAAATTSASSHPPDQDLDEEDDQKEEEEEEEADRKRPRTEQPDIPPPLSREEEEMQFLQILNQLNPSPYAVWELERTRWEGGAFHGIQVRLPEAEQQRMFEEYCQAAAQAAAAGAGRRPGAHEDGELELASDAQEAEGDATPPKTPFGELLDLVTPGMFYDEFCRKFRKDPRYASLPDLRERAWLFKLRAAELKAGRKQAPPPATGGKRTDATSGTGEVALRSLERREQQVALERVALERERARQRQLLEQDTLARAFVDYLVIHVKSHAMTWDAFRQGAHPPILLPEAEQRRLFAAHCDRLLERRQAAFAAHITAHFPLQQRWTEEVATALSRVPAYQALGLSEPEGRKLFAHVQAQRHEEADRRFRELLAECKFLHFHVKHAVLTLQGASAASLSDAATAAAAAKPTLLTFSGDDEDEGGVRAKPANHRIPSPAAFGAEGRHISLADIYGVLRTDARFLDTPEQRATLERYVVEVLERFRAERGGTLDKVIAAHAGAQSLSSRGTLH